MNERLSWNEAEAVVRAYRAEHGASADVDVATLARALGTDAAEVRRLAGRKPRFVDRSGIVSAGLALAFVALGAIVMGPRPMWAPPLRTALHRAPSPGSPQVLIYTDRNGKVSVIDAGNIPKSSPSWIDSAEGETKL